MLAATHLASDNEEAAGKSRGRTKLLVNILEVPAQQPASDLCGECQSE